MRLINIAAVLLCALIGASNAQSQSWVIGHSAPMTGSNAEFGKAIRDGANAYFTMINKQGGVAGAQIELLTMDDGNSRKSAGENAAKLLANPEVVALYGFASATLSLDAMPLAERSSTLFFAPFSGANPVRKPSPVVFNLRASYGDELEKMLKIWTALGFQRIVVVHYDDEVGRQNFGIVAEYLERIGSKPVAFSMERNAEINEASFQKLLALRPEVIINTVLSKPAAELTKRIRTAGLVVPISSISFVGAQQFLDIVGSNGAGMSISQVVPNPNSALPINRECSKAMADYGVKEAMNTTHLEACIGAKVLTEAMRRSRKPGDRKALLAAIRNLGAFDAGGFTVNYSPSQNNGSKFVEMALVSRDGKLRF